MHENSDEWVRDIFSDKNKTSANPDENSNPLQPLPPHSVYKSAELQRDLYFNTNTGLNVAVHSIRKTVLITVHGVLQQSQITKPIKTEKVVLSASGLASPTYPPLCCAVVRSQSWGLQQIILPTGSPTQLRPAEHREPASASESAEHICLSGRTWRDWPQSHTWQMPQERDLFDGLH